MKSKLWILIIGLGLIAGVITFIRVFTTGFVLYAKTDVLVWTLPLAMYIFLSLTSSGLAFISSIPMVFGVKRYEPIEKRVLLLEIAVLAAAFVCLIMHLGSPWNVFYLLLSPNPASPLWWLAMLYGAYLAALLASFYKLHTDRASRPLGVLVMLIALATSTALGWLIGMADARPVLNPTFLTVFFPITAFGSGLAVLLVFGSFSAPVEETKEVYLEIGRIFTVVTGFTLVLLIWRTIIGGVSSNETQFAAFRHMLSSWSYHLELWIGLVAPLLILLSPRVRQSVKGLASAGFLFLVGMLAGRLEFLLSGEVMPLGPLAEGRPEFVSYFPTVSEVLVGVFALSALLLIYILGERYFKPGVAGREN